MTIKNDEHIKGGKDLTRLDVLEEKVGELLHRVKGLADAIDDINKRISELEEDAYDEDEEYEKALAEEAEYTPPGTPEAAK